MLILYSLTVHMVYGHYCVSSPDCVVSSASKVKDLTLYLQKGFRMISECIYFTTTYFHAQESQQFFESLNMMKQFIYGCSWCWGDRQCRNGQTLAACQLQNVIKCWKLTVNLYNIALFQKTSSNVTTHNPITCLRNILLFTWCMATTVFHRLIVQSLVLVK